MYLFLNHIFYEAQTWDARHWRYSNEKDTLLIKLIIQQKRKMKNYKYMGIGSCCLHIIGQGTCPDQRE